MYITEVIVEGGVVLDCIKLRSIYLFIFICFTGLLDH